MTVSLKFIIWILYIIWIIYIHGWASFFHNLRIGTYFSLYPLNSFINTMISPFLSYLYYLLSLHNIFELIISQQMVLEFCMERTGNFYMELSLSCSEFYTISKVLPIPGCSGHIVVVLHVVLHSLVLWK